MNSIPHYHKYPPAMWAELSATARSHPARPRSPPPWTPPLWLFISAYRTKGFLPGEGLIKGDVEETIKSMGYIGRVGMKTTDTEILNVMIDRVNVDQYC